jgi:uncharacterized protein involved in exopolysaccharide biosynthesis
MGIDIFQLPGILLRRWLYVVVTMVLCAGVAAAFIVLRKPVFQATTEILIDPQGLSASPPDPRLGQPLGQDDAAISSQIFIVLSGEVLNPVVDKLNLTSDRYYNPTGVNDRDVARVTAAAVLKKNLLVEREGSSFVLTLTAKHRDAAMAAKVANTVASIYIQRLHDARADATSRVGSAFQLQAQQLADKMRRAEEELEKFKEANNLVATGPQQNLVIDQQVEGVNRQLIAARADLETKRANYNQIKGLTVGSIEAGGIPEALSSTALSAMRSRYADLVARADQMSTTLGANHPQMQAARSQVAGLRQEMEQELGRIRQSLKGGLERAEANAAALQRRLDSLTASSLDTSETGIKARQLQSEIDALRALYKTLLTRASELGERDSANLNNSRVISSAVPGGGTSFVLKLILIAAGALFGIALGSGLAVLREVLSRMLAVGGEPRERTAALAARPQDVAAAPAAEKGTADTIPAATEATRAPARLPVIAHIPAMTPAHRPAMLSGRQFLEAARPDRSIQIGLSRAAEALMQHSGEQPSTILFISPDNDNGTGRLVPDVADALHRKHKEVLYSEGSGGHDATAAEAPLADRLKFRRLATGGSGSDRTAPTFSAFAGSRRKADFIIIDANGEEARHHLGELLDQANGIMLVARDGEEERLDELVDSLAPWRDRMLGTITLGNVA